MEAFVPQSHQPGMEAEVDFGDVKVWLAGELVTCYLFSFRLSYSGKAVHRVFASCGQEAFFEGHVHALRTLGGVPPCQHTGASGTGRGGLINHFNAWPATAEDRPGRRHASGTRPGTKGPASK
ncbi:hypothetical protein [Streptomyces venezuelae]|uniref:hypothetical protein n=1 Tax=Streptomyces venezuelae TaxID=54571 RepID=UPI001CC9CE3E|nr:hypothetical protein [Streptomyces venezuelae]